MFSLDSFSERELVKRVEDSFFATTSIDLDENGQIITQQCRRSALRPRAPPRQGLGHRRGPGGAGRRPPPRRGPDGLFGPIRSWYQCGSRTYGSKILWGGRWGEEGGGGGSGEETEVGGGGEMGERRGGGGGRRLRVRSEELASVLNQT